MRFLTLIFGTMGSGKTAELLLIINKLQENNSRLPIGSKLRFMVFKPIIETRSDKTTIVSRNGQRFDDVIAVSNLLELAPEISKNAPDVIIIDECQFFETGIGNDPWHFTELIRELLTAGKRVILCGLIQNCYGGKFEILSSLCPEADEILNPHTTCSCCDNIASRSQRLQIGYPTPITDPIFLVDDFDNHYLGYSYEPRCNDCWELPIEPHPNLVIFRNTPNKISDLKP